jgi:chemotaxis family two-component system sensor kinase Cph1
MNQPTHEPIVDIESCAREPIHIPGAIQPHGVLLVLSVPNLQIMQVSENCDLILGIPTEFLLGKGLSSFLDAAQMARVQFALQAADPAENNPVRLELLSRHEAGRLDGVVHSHDGLYILELEPSLPPQQSYFLDFYRNIAKCTDRLYAAQSMRAVLNEAANGVRQITGFDRVMIYRFMENGDGEVLAESKRSDVEPYLGLRYPASDIPEQARQLYLLSPIRNIPEVPYTPVPLLPAINPETRRPADLSYASLRSVSPVHCEYLMNMGVAASMSVSIVRDGKLWGLVACHHLSPKFLSYEVRRACCFVGQVLAGEIGRREAAEESAFAMRATMMQARFLELVAAPSSGALFDLTHSNPTLLDYLPAGGAAVVIADKVQSCGATPSDGEVLSLMKRLRSAGAPNTFFTNCLRNHFAAFETMAHTASGVIALEVSREPSSYIFFFRPEVTQTVTWGGDPAKAVVAKENGFRLSPRKSFAAWKEKSRATALPWTKLEIRAADELRKLIVVVTAKK